jgi:hypothetical protein
VRAVSLQRRAKLLDHDLFQNQRIDDFDIVAPKRHARHSAIVRFASALAVDMTDDPLDAMKARWSYIQGF